MRATIVDTGNSITTGPGDTASALSLAGPDRFARLRADLYDIDRPRGSERRPQPPFPLTPTHPRSLREINLGVRSNGDTSPPVSGNEGRHVDDPTSDDVVLAGVAHARGAACQRF